MGINSVEQSYHYPFSKHRNHIPFKESLLEGMSKLSLQQALKKTFHLKRQIQCRILIEKKLAFLMASNHVRSSKSFVRRKSLRSKNKIK